MKAITLWQPWASLLACGAKEFETRSWATSYRGPIAIHAAARIFDTRDLPAYVVHAMVQAVRPIVDKMAHTAIYLPLEMIPRGCIIATAELIGCHKMVRRGGRGLSSDSPGWLETENGIYEPTDQELLFGDWTPGRYAWEFANMKMLETPIHAKGGQRIWNWEDGRA